MSRDYAAEVRKVRERHARGSYVYRTAMVSAVVSELIRSLAEIDQRPAEERMADIVAVLDAFEEDR